MCQGWSQLYKHCGVIQLHLPNSTFLEWHWTWRFVFCTSILLYGNIILWSFIDRILKPFRNNRLSGCLSGCLSLHFFLSFCVSIVSSFCISFETLVASEFSDFSDLVPKLRHENEAKCEVALIDVQNKEPC